MSRQNETFYLKDYGRKSTFASFLPGIAGVKGIPIWCYYVNRGQGVVCFGVENKDHSIMEFLPAHQAYQNVKRTGFRTFVRKDGEFFEPFSDETLQQTMEIKMNAMSISEEDQQHGLTTQVSYFILPEEKVGALVRKVTFTNSGDKTFHLEYLDGMPALIPYGVELDSIKEMAQTAKAWMQVEDAETRVPFYRVRASMADSAAVRTIEGGNFAVAFDEEGTKLTAIVDPESMFSYDNSLSVPVIFKENGLSGVLGERQNCSNLLPAAFFGGERELAPSESVVIYEMIGQVAGKSYLEEYLKRQLTAEYFEKKYDRAIELVDELCKTVETKTGDSRFDAYCKYTYMDNLLRGGYPMKLGNNKIFYMYSRKHGDIERDYNFFAMAPEFFSQGNGNFRDVNQNRRCDTFFAPFVGTENIHTFYSLIQLDGYNPLSVEKLTYVVNPDRAKCLVEELTERQQEKILTAITKPFTPGKLYGVLQETLATEKVEKLFYSILDFAEATVNASFGEGYWTDHWTYNLDLVEEYLSVFPEREEELLDENNYFYFQTQAKVNPRTKRYELTENGVRQYYALNEDIDKSKLSKDKLVRLGGAEGEILRASLLEKLLLLCTVKFATLDPYGMGIEMEGGKPGWYDALNGMPGLFGSSMSETFELARMLDYTIGALKRHPKNVDVLKELAELIRDIGAINEDENEKLKSEKEVLSFWNRVNDAKESYREKVYAGVSGEKTRITAEELTGLLEGFRRTVEYGVEKANSYGEGVCPTYFTYEVTRYEKNEQGIVPQEFRVVLAPYFLEGPVRYLKLPKDQAHKRELYRNVKNSDLYDDKLSMYKVNASLENASYELGRARAFTPGWLENESIWLHMEYKYLLELLKSGLYEEFAEDFKKAAIPFLDEEVYGRSVLENSSFIASSKNPNPKIHGKGFVARLSGSTIEFIQMWRIMMFGRNPFTQENGKLVGRFAPMIPSYLLSEDLTVTSTFLGGTAVNYHFAEKKDYFPGNYKVTGMKVKYHNGAVAEVGGESLNSETCQELRKGLIASVDVTIA